jgi:hypothetical protein
MSTIDLRGFVGDGLHNPVCSTHGQLARTPGESRHGKWCVLALQNTIDLLQRLHHQALCPASQDAR